MKKYTLFLFLFLLLVGGCAAPVKLITPPTEPLGRYKQFMIFSMKNDVIGKVDNNVLKRIISQSVERIHELNYFDAIIVDDSISVDTKLQSSLKIIRRTAFNGDSASVAVMQVTLTDYDEGSATLRFFFAPFAGMGKVGCDIDITSNETKKELLRARTVSQISSISSGADEVITPIAKALTNVVEKYFVKKYTK